MAGPLPRNFDPRQLAGMMPSMEMPRKQTLHEQLEMHIKRGEKAKELLKMLDENPAIREFVERANEL